MERTIKIGNASVGIIGLEGAVNKLKSRYRDDSVSPRDAAKELLSLIKEKNYVPLSAEPVYLEALEKVWEQEHGRQGQEAEDDLRIRILGPGCVSCNRLEEMVMQVLSEKGIAADIEHVRELDEIWRYNVIQTPALVIGRKVLCSGRMPTMAQVRSWLNELI